MVCWVFADDAAIRHLCGTEALGGEPLEGEGTCLGDAQGLCDDDHQRGENSCSKPLPPTVSCSRFVRDDRCGSWPWSISANAREGSWRVCWTHILPHIALLTTFQVATITRQYINGLIGPGRPGLVGFSPSAASSGVARPEHHPPSRDGVLAGMQGTRAKLDGQTDSTMNSTRRPGV